RKSPVHIASGVGVGLCVVAGWAVTGLAFDELADRPVAPISLTFVRPAGDSLEWLQRYTALGLPGFGVATVIGSILGAFATAVAMKRFAITTFSDKGDTIHVLSGSALMGVGGVLALGCTVGQGITGVSTLAVGSFIAFAAIVTGGVIGMKAFERILMAEA
ncbi:MAG TPA: YeeE/YedE thiosulfate transporter family protein, partial [Thermomicrobiales bacterium]|nr:YeeE/YedE thiosulfate transporter family protein [Thermomicrobiales bacterium]